MNAAKYILALMSRFIVKFQKATEIASIDQQVARFTPATPAKLRLWGSPADPESGSALRGTASTS